MGNSFRKMGCVVIPPNTPTPTHKAHHLRVSKINLNPISVLIPQRHLVVSNNGADHNTPKRPDTPRPKKSIRIQAIPPYRSPKNKSIHNINKHRRKSSVIIQQKYTEASSSCSFDVNYDTNVHTYDMGIYD
jgi:hypothetical protein